MIDSIHALGVDWEHDIHVDPWQRHDVTYSNGHFNFVFRPHPLPTLLHVLFFQFGTCLLRMGRIQRKIYQFKPNVIGAEHPLVVQVYVNYWEYKGTLWWCIHEHFIIGVRTPSGGALTLHITCILLFIVMFWSKNKIVQFNVVCSLRVKILFSTARNEAGAR